MFRAPRHCATSPAAPRGAGNLRIGGGGPVGPSAGPLIARKVDAVGFGYVTV
ncbi:hypothetical protein IBTHAUMO2_620005 [Nitrosopumilaceae archaeon]|nr:hypothetical protein IBTHAUMO2_620005 [Nitrosopumilaceae archaeon]